MYIANTQMKGILAKLEKKYSCDLYCLKYDARMIVLFTLFIYMNKFEIITFFKKIIFHVNKKLFSS